MEDLKDIEIIKEDKYKCQAEFDKRKYKFELFYNIRHKGLNNTAILLLMYRCCYKISCI